MLSTVSYQSILERSFAAVRNTGGQMDKRAAAVQTVAALSIKFADGNRLGRRAETANETGPRDRSGGWQGSLF